MPAKLIHPNFDLGYLIKPSGVQGLITFEVSQSFPQAQHPRWQPKLQLTLPPSDLWDLASYIQATLASTRSR